LVSDSVSRLAGAQRPEPLQSRPRRRRHEGRQRVGSPRSLPEEAAIDRPPAWQDRV